ncbi:hypothetical protein ADL22_00355 [Streptomyces sp. NRRL F-4489]|nr:hypothetical protein ADL22_00355 [Streptomyces sp. NRRL F-4489]
MLEFYDFFVYSPLAVLVFADVFFPAQSPGAGALLALSTFAVGFIARPIGGLLAGHLGDRVGRRPMLVATFLFTGAVTFAVGLLPTYAQIGVWAPALLVTLRFLQGIGLGGEWGGAALLAVEHAPEHRRAFFGSLISASAPLGVILANGVVAVLTGTLTRSQLLAWGWRIPFLVSIVLVIVGLLLRMKVEETPEFARLRSANRPSPSPVLQVLRRHPRQILAVVAIHAGPTTVGFLSGTFLVGYAVKAMHLSPAVALTGTITGSVVHFVLTLLIGRFADRGGQRRFVSIGGAAIIVWAFPMFWLAGLGQVGALFCAFIGVAVVQAFISTPEPAFYASLFGPETRYSGMSIGYQTATIIGGGAGPLVIQALVDGSGGATWPASLYLAGVGVLVLVAALTVRTATAGRGEGAGGGAEGESGGGAGESAATVPPAEGATT